MDKAERDPKHALEILRPIRENFFQRQKKMNDFLELTLGAFTVIQQLPELVELSSKIKGAKPQPAGRLELFRKVAAVAKAEETSGYATTLNFATIFTWGALETAVRDMAVNWLTLVPEARNHDKLARLRIPLFEYDSLQSDERMRFVLNALENELNATFKPGIGKFESVLKEIGLRGAVKEAVKKPLFEMAAVRNVLVHKTGIADQRFVRACPWFGVKIGEPVLVSIERYAEYRKRVLQYASILTARVLIYFGITSDEQSPGSGSSEGRTIQ
jgi:hypothetical protein